MRNLLCSCCVARSFDKVSTLHVISYRWLVSIEKYQYFWTKIKPFKQKKSLKKAPKYLLQWWFGEKLLPFLLVILDPLVSGMSRLLCWLAVWLAGWLLGAGRLAGRWLGGRRRLHLLGLDAVLGLCRLDRTHFMLGEEQQELWRLWNCFNGDSFVSF